MRTAVLFAAFLITLAAVTAAAQETPVATLANEFRTEGNCETTLAAADRFFSELSNNPVSQGYIVIYRQGHNTASARSRRREITNWVKIRHFDPMRITFLEGTVQVEAKTQFWLVPPGAEPPMVVPDDPKALAIPKPKVAETVEIDPSEPYIFTAEYADGIEGCKDPFDKEGFAQELKDNPAYRGNIVIAAGNKVDFREMERVILSELASYGVNPKLLRTFYVKASLPSTELWILPRKSSVRPKSKL